MFHRKRSLFSISVIALVLSACGFQLRGSVAIPVELHQLSLHCSNELSKVLCQTLNKQLTLNDVNLVEDNKADYILSITSLNSSRRAVSITNRAVAVEYEVTNKATFNLIAADQTIIIDNATTSARQTYRFDEDNVISKTREEEQVKEQINKLLASKIISRLTPYNKLRIEKIKAAQAQ
ncbi:LPS-assembly lipoprotein LptE [Alkalimarinus alittae]|uniref:LPS-assembly lipoprotein LptE n=1 Tax=Alkalimarinus alittae TaxID=2961619 RepID=A0ABY6N537_9ALTE|nr:LPS assembly lipoprotein LptE [Alkalimarinus alittae]UZE97097.1 LPS assembly lipoprotein LptE [Alkalimarinus alittae]